MTTSVRSSCLSLSLGISRSTCYVQYSQRSAAKTCSTVKETRSSYVLCVAKTRLSHPWVAWRLRLLLCASHVTSRFETYVDTVDRLLLLKRSQREGCLPRISTETYERKPSSPRPGRRHCICSRLDYGFLLGLRPASHTCAVNRCAPDTPSCNGRLCLVLSQRHNVNIRISVPSAFPTEDQANGGGDRPNPAQPAPSRRYGPFHQLCLSSTTRDWVELWQP